MGNKTLLAAAHSGKKNLLAAHSGKKNLLAAHSGKNHDWQHILGKKT